MLVLAETLLWFTLVASIFTLPAIRRGYLRLSRKIDSLTGGMFVIFGLHLIFARQVI